MVTSDRDGEQAAVRAGEHAPDIAGDRRGDLLRPGREEEIGDAAGEVGLADRTGKRRDEDQEREDRHQRSTGRRGSTSPSRRRR